MTAGVQLGGPNRPAIQILREWPGGFYLSPRVNNSDPELQQFIIDQYFTNGAALFGRETPEEIAQMRRAAKGGFEGQDDRQVMLVVEHLFIRVSNYAHIASLVEAGIDEAISDSSMCPYGHLHALKVVDIPHAADEIETFKRMTHRDYGQYAFGQQITFPPFFLGCLCRLMGAV